VLASLTVIFLIPLTVTPLPRRADGRLAPLALVINGLIVIVLTVLTINPLLLRANGPLTPLTQGIISGLILRHSSVGDQWLEIPRTRHHDPRHHDEKRARQERGQSGNRAVRSHKHLSSGLGCPLRQ